jgi:hypothetical protein
MDGCTCSSLSLSPSSQRERGDRYISYCFIYIRHEEKEDEGLASSRKIKLAIVFTLQCHEIQYLPDVP